MESQMKSNQKQKLYWRRNLRITGLLFVLWFLMTFGVSYFARELNEFSIFGFPLGFYMGAQGSLLIYLAIIWYYARYMNALDQKYGGRDGGD
jgi:putative solute:sodium symporter small subunit